MLKRNYIYKDDLSDWFGEGLNAKLIIWVREGEVLDDTKTKGYTLL